MSKYSYIIRNSINANFANNMMRYMAARKLSNELPEPRLSNYVMPEWGINFVPLDPVQGTTAEFLDPMRMDYFRIKYLIECGVLQVNLHGHMQRMECFQTPEETRLLFKAEDAIGESFGDEYIVCPVRAGEILDGRHSGYTLIPINFYKEVIEKSGKKPVFMGQTEPNIYMNAIREAFPDAIYLKTFGPLGDFQTIRKSRNLVVPISSFAWLAAWLANASEIILPVFGLFNPEHHSLNDLLPVSDPRYTFYKFPLQDSVRVEDVLGAHKSLDGNWKLCNPDEFIRLY